MRLFLDTNVWSYVADCGAASDLARVARRSKVEIVVSPAIVDEVTALPNEGARKKALALVTDPQWKRLMPESFSESVEVKKEILRLRPAWKVTSPKLAEVNRLRYDWVRRSGGFWHRARASVASQETDESLRADREFALAKEESYQIRQRLVSARPAANTHLQYVAGLPDAGTAGWSGDPVHYWRVPSLYFFQSELLIYASPVREWIDAEVDVAAMMSDSASMNRLWLHEMDPHNVPRQWLRGAFEFLQAWHKVTDGTPGDSRLATHLVEVDQFVSADKNFVRFAERCRVEAPFRLAQARRISGGREGVDQLLALVAEPRASTAGLTSP
ncbi:PIN domain-containing protein [Bordetella genomosp. 5]|uniref:Uncharacterized protein n=1 Tax=Bordetella genomosp. 5 TaxID=1395608 RepID=A0A261TBH5_9BORD|nr:PIN domain-containing protein [Bordetella genomosp. 5]OZI46939.1 hypothetical protein CAL25_19950 [Bordetella genomosp. 5]